MERTVKDQLNQTIFLNVSALYFQVFFVTHIKLDFLINGALFKAAMLCAIKYMIRYNSN